MRSIGSDVRHALRTMSTHGAFTLTALLTLALGIGATTAMFSLVYGVLLRPLPYDEPDQIMRVYAVNSGVPHPVRGDAVRHGGLPRRSGDLAPARPYGLSRTGQTCGPHRSSRNPPRRMSGLRRATSRLTYFARSSEMPRERLSIAARAARILARPAAVTV